MLHVRSHARGEMQKQMQKQIKVIFCLLKENQAQRTDL